MNKYSVLMSVYYKESPVNFKEGIDSMINQTVKPNDFVLVCDGPLSDELDKVIQEKKEELKDVFQIVRLSRNEGLGNALNHGIEYCKNEVVARMDSDDISTLDRCERQLKVFEDNPELSIVSGTVLEFEGSIEKITGKRELPEEHKDIINYSKKRSPFNHPAVMFKKSDVMAAGGYTEEYHLMEDYDLWVRMLKSGKKGYNIQEPVLYMRIDKNMYKRRGGIEYGKDVLRFHGMLRKSGWSTSLDYWCGAVLHAAICMLPSVVRGVIYRVLH